MIPNNNKFKKIFVFDAGFSNSIVNICMRNNIRTVYDLIESYNSGALRRIKGVGAGKISEVLNYPYDTLLRGDKIIPQNGRKREGSFSLAPSEQIKNYKVYKDISLNDLSFSVRIKHPAWTNGIYTLWDLIDSYNSGEFEHFVVDKSFLDEIKEFPFEELDYLFDIDNLLDEEIITEDEDIDPKDKLGEEFLSKGIQEVISDHVYMNRFHTHSIKTIQQLFDLTEEEMYSWYSFGRSKVEKVMELRRRLLEGEDCCIANGKVLSKDEPYPSREIDTRTLEVLKDHFYFSYNKLCLWYDITRQRVDQKIKKAETKTWVNWQGFELTEEYIELFREMLREREVERRDGNVFCYFLKDYLGDYAFLYVDETKICCFFLNDLPQEMQDYITTTHDCIFDKREDEIVEKGEKYSLLKVDYFQPAQSTYSTYKSYAEKRGLTPEDYIYLLTGRKLGGKHFTTDERIIEFLKNRVNEEGKVYISSKPESQWLRSFASRNGYLIADFVALYGFQYALGESTAKETNTDTTRERHIERMQRYIIEDNIVYIPSYCDFYRVLAAAASACKKNITEYIEDLGFERSMIPGDVLLREEGSAYVIDESDMKIYEEEDDKYKNIFAQNPLIGDYLLSSEELDTIHKEAQRIIDQCVAIHRYFFNEEEKRIIALSVINYTQGWDSTDDTYTAYLLKQYGYREFPNLYNYLIKATFYALEEAGRWAFRTKTEFEFKSTFLIHAMSPMKAWIALCDFLSDFYQNNLNCQYEEDDPSILNAVLLIRRKLIRENAQEEESLTIGSKPYLFQEGIRKLIIYKPEYTSNLFRNIIKRIDSYMNGNVQKPKKYHEKIVDSWFEVQKERYLQEPERKRKASGHVGVKVVFDYERIRPEFKLKDEKVYISIPDIRLLRPSQEACYLEVLYNGAVIDRKTLKCYGNELGRTIEGVDYLIHDFLSLDGEGIEPQIIIKNGEDVIHDSEHRLFRKEICFQNGRETTIHEDGNYFVLAKIQDSLEGENAEISIIRDIFNYRLSFVEAEDGFVLLLNDSIYASDRHAMQKVRVAFPGTISNVCYVENGIKYDICNHKGDISIFMDEEDVEQKYMIYLNETPLAFSMLKKETKEGIIRFTIGGDSWNEEKNHLKVVDFQNHKTIFEVRFLLLIGFEPAFNQPFYYEEQEIRDCIVEYSILGEEYEAVNVDADPLMRIEYLDGEIQFELPIVRILDEKGEDWRYQDKHIKDVDRGLYLRSVCEKYPINSVFTIGENVLSQDERGNCPVGNELHALDAKKEYLKVTITYGGFSKEYKLARIFFKDSFLVVPQITYKDKVLSWDMGRGFIGDLEKKTILLIGDDRKKNVYTGEIRVDSPVLCENIELEEGLYYFSIYRESDNLFSQDRYFLVKGRTFYVGNIDQFRFKNKKIRITQMLFEEIGKTEPEIIDIGKIYIDHIKYDEELSKQECSEGICPIYHGIIYYNDGRGERKELSYCEKQLGPNTTQVLVNPVRITYINDNVILVNSDEGEALFYEGRFSQTKLELKYYITDKDSSGFKNKICGTTDLLRYEKENL